MKQVSVLVVGAGSRGSHYASFAEAYPDRARVVGVAEPRGPYRERLVRTHGISPENAATDWHELAERPRFADAVIIATPDKAHAAPAVAFANKGYHMLLEKPMAPNEADCRRIVETVLSNQVLFAVCHVLRYTAYTRNVKRMVESGLIGDVVSIQHLEPVGYWHQAHSFVRGNWRKESESSSMLLQKCCHDLDWIRYIIGVPCRAVSSFGALKHFRKEEKPTGAGERCLECDCEGSCPYSAKRIYLGHLEKGNTGWPVDVLTPEVNCEGVIQALREGPYGRCVYDCDNDVVDNQVVNMLFEGGRTATLTMTAFTQTASRKTRIFGTKGEIDGDGSAIRHFDFMTDKWREIETQTSEHTILGGHGGGDYGVIHSFLEAVAGNDQRKIISGPRETLESHLMVFAAERARLGNTVEELDMTLLPNSAR